jgi:ankyrin repeat protein
LKVYELIMDTLEDKNPGDNYGWTPLHFAVRNDNLKVCDLIMKILQDKNPSTPNGYTPLHIAAIRGHFNLCKLICKNVSKIDVVEFQNNVGWTPMKYAVFNKNWSVVWLLALFQSALQ